MTLKANKVVLISRSGYNKHFDSLLKDLIARRIKLFCAVGIDCEKWEEVMDELCVGPNGLGTHMITTTSHPDESADDVLKFEHRWEPSSENDVEVIEV